MFVGVAIISNIWSGQSLISHHTPTQHIFYSLKQTKILDVTVTRSMSAETSVQGKNIGTLP